MAVEAAQTVLAMLGAVAGLGLLGRALMREHDRRVRAKSLNYVPAATKRGA